MIDGLNDVCVGYVQCCGVKGRWKNEEDVLYDEENKVFGLVVVKSMNDEVNNYYCGWKCISVLFKRRKFQLDL